MIKKIIMIITTMIITCHSCPEMAGEGTRDEHACVHMAKFAEAPTNNTQATPKPETLNPKSMHQPTSAACAAATRSCGGASVFVKMSMRDCTNKQR